MGFLIPDFKCPTCGGKLLAREFRAGKPWICSTCSRQFRVSRTYIRTVVWSVVGLLLIFFRIQGGRGWPLLAAAVVCLVPVLYILIPILYRVIPPRLEPYQPVALDNDSENASPRTEQPQTDEKRL